MWEYKTHRKQFNYLRCPQRTREQNKPKQHFYFALAAKHQTPCLTYPNRKTSRKPAHKQEEDKWRQEGDGVGWWAVVGLEVRGLRKVTRTMADIAAQQGRNALCRRSVAKFPYLLALSSVDTPFTLTTHHPQPTSQRVPISIPTMQMEGKQS